MENKINLERERKLPQVVEIVSPTSYKNNKTMNIYVRISSNNIRVSITPFQYTHINHGVKCNFKHNWCLNTYLKHSDINFRHPKLKVQTSHLKHLNFQSLDQTSYFKCLDFQTLKHSTFKHLDLKLTTQTLHT